MKESDANACNSAIDARDYGTAKSICTDRKDKASAYMGLAGYDIINLLKSSGSSTKKYDDDNVSGDGLKKDDVSGLSILNLLRLSVNEYDNDTIRTTKIKASKNYLDSASALLHPCISDNCTPPITTDEILLDTFALSFAMQLNQLILYDNATTSTTPIPDNNSEGILVCDNATARTASELRAMDGHLWTAERDGIQCNSLKSAIADIGDNDTKLAVIDNITNRKAGQKLPSAIYTPVCKPILSLTGYLDNLTESINKLVTLSGDNTTLSGDNTKAITDAKTSTDNLTKTVGCVE
ncbi:MAG: hypothetical protein MK216_05365 [Candidatus Nitrosopelagicus sp.]|nr:hypothetical protein [Candidatus Nitrosopelagicus sp.]